MSARGPNNLNYLIITSSLGNTYVAYVSQREYEQDLIVMQWVAGGFGPRLGGLVESAADWLANCAWPNLNCDSLRYCFPTPEIDT
jgi:hypothetical protein